ncbi:SDR family oxidoreductase [Ruminococcaceae bacterium OttesenSCG-928-L11]|nr:SDR family oxidoreductase [Ruminococcaceae bacterium OttesenSCG-928-L11]
MEFLNKVCVVTGGANGIGRCIVERFLAEGAKVVVIDMDNEAGRQLAACYDDKRLLFYHGDIADKAVLEDFAWKVVDRHRWVDCLVNNACVSRKGLLSSCAYEDFEYVLRVGVIAPYYLTNMLKSSLGPGASIVNISSTRAEQSQPNTESYSAAKGGVGALTHALSISLAGRARVNAISPGWIETSQQEAEPDKADMLQHPAGRIGTPADIAELALFLCSDKAGFLTGENIVVDGGMSRQMIYHGDHGWRFTPGDERDAR